MIRGVVDTHALIWFLLADPRLSGTALKFIKDAEFASDQIAVSSITLIEVIYLIEKRRVNASALPRLMSVIDQAGAFVEFSVDRGVSIALTQVDRGQVPDMPDRIIAATAVHLGVPLISRDRKIVASSVTTIW